MIHMTSTENFSTDCPTISIHKSELRKGDIIKMYGRGFSFSPDAIPTIKKVTMVELREWDGGTTVEINVISSHKGAGWKPATLGRDVVNVELVSRAF